MAIAGDDFRRGAGGARRDFGRDGSGGAFVRGGVDRVAGPQHAVQVDRELARQVLEEGVAILSNEKNGGIAAASGSSAASSGSVEGSDAKPEVHSLMCVPLNNLDKAIGLIYLDTTNPSGRFTNEDLQLVTVTAGIASMAFEKRAAGRMAGQREPAAARAEVDLDHWHGRR